MFIRATTLTAALVLVGSLAVPAAAAAATGGPAARVTGMPSGVPAAATRAEPRLPVPRSWPFPESFPRTEGAGRLAGGALLWTDFLYDDHGAVGPGAVTGASDLAPTLGGYRYPAGPAHGNGADIFRAAVGATRAASYWRVDWNTLVKPRVPVAEWTFDTDHRAGTGSTAWPGNAGLSSPGIDTALIMSSHGARLVSVATGKVRHRFRVTVDRRARSFVVRIPRSALHLSGNWRIRLAAGLANPAGTGFATVPASNGGVGENAYNVSFRSYRQEPELYCPEGTPLPTSGHTPVTECGNFWMENHQAQALASGDVSAFARTVVWRQLSHRRHTAEPLPTGYSNRWYVSRLHLGQGVVDNSSPQGDLEPNYLGRVQPYAVYVPTGYRPRHPVPLTWVLHSLGANLNQYGGVAPSQLREECQARQSICATTEGYGPDGWYFDAAEVDFWQVWHALAASYRLRPEQTVMSGYSMGGFASYKLALAYPDLFAQAMPLEGPVICGIRVAGDVQGSGGGSPNGHCSKDSDTVPTLVNARWLPYVMTYGFVDELVPVTGGLTQVNAFDRLGYRYHAVLFPTEDHMVFALQNDFSFATSQLRHRHRTRNPGHITYVWYPRLTNHREGIGPTGVYWIRGLAARSAKPGQRARIDARSAAIPDPRHTVVRSTHPLPRFHPTPAVVRQLTWRVGHAPAARQRLAVRTQDVTSFGIDLHRAGLRCGATIVTRTDGPAVVRLLRMRPGAVVYDGAHRLATASAHGTARFRVPRGHEIVSLCRRAV